MPRDRGFADFKHTGVVAVKVVFVDDRDVDVGDVARLQNLLLGRNAVADDVIYRNAGGGRIRTAVTRRVVEARRTAL